MSETPRWIPWAHRSSTKLLAMFTSKSGVALHISKLTLDGSGTVDDATSGFSCGATVGMTFDKNAAGLSYRVLPEFDDFEGLNLDADVDFSSCPISITLPSAASLLRCRCSPCSLAAAPGGITTTGLATKQRSASTQLSVSSLTPCFIVFYCSRVSEVLTDSAELIPSDNDPRQGATYTMTKTSNQNKIGQEQFSRRDAIRQPMVSRCVEK